MMVVVRVRVMMMMVVRRSTTTAGTYAATTGTASSGTRIATLTVMMVVAVMAWRGTRDGSRCSGGSSCRSRGCRRRTRRIVKVIIVASVVVIVEWRIGEATASAAAMRIIRVPVIVVIKIYGTSCRIGFTRSEQPKQKTPIRFEMSVPVRFSSLYRVLWVANRWRSGRDLWVASMPPFCGCARFRVCASEEKKRR